MFLTLEHRNIDQCYTEEQEIKCQEASFFTVYYFFLFFLSSFYSLLSYNLYYYVRQYETKIEIKPRTDF